MAKIPKLPASKENAWSALTPDQRKRFEGWGVTKTAGEKLVPPPANAEDCTPQLLRAVLAPLNAVPPSRGIYDQAELSEARARYWLSMDGWTAKESALLLCAIDPAAIALLETRPGGANEVLALEWPLHFDDLHRLVARAVDVGVLGTFAAPTVVLEWADTKDLRMPAAMINFRASQLMHLDSSKISDRRPTEPLQRKQAHKSTILAALQSLGIDPKKLPAPPPGKQFPEKAASRAVASLSHDVFNKAWQELLNDGAIVVKHL